MRLRPVRHAVVEAAPQQREQRDNRQLFHLNELAMKLQKTKPAYWGQ